MKHKNIIIFNKSLNYAKEIIDFSIEASFKNFENKKTIATVGFNISQIGELVKVLDKCNKIYWIRIECLRNRMVNDYEGIK